MIASSASRPLPTRLAVFAIGIIAIVALLWAFGVLRFGGAAPEPAGAAGVAPFQAPVPEVVTSGPSRVDYARLDARITRLMEEPAMVGLAVAVIEDGQIRFARGYGVTTGGTYDAVTAATVFRWASLSKGVAGDMVALLAARRQLTLADPVNRWSSSLRLPNGNEARANIADLLSHTLGIHGHAYDARLEDGEDPRYLRGLLAFVPQSCPPGSCHAYQNVAFDASSEVVERVTGVPFEQALRDEMFRPLGMSTASASRQGLESAPSWARPHRGGGRNALPEPVLEPYYRVAAAGGVNGSIMDLALWMRAQMGLAPQVLPPEVLTAVQAPRVNTPGETRRRRRYLERTPRSFYGLGWRVFDYAGRRVIGHHGGVRGYRSLILFDPAQRSGVVALWNSSTGRPNAIEYEVMDQLYGLPFRDWLELERAGGAPAPPPEEEPEEVSGSVEPKRGRPDAR